MKFERSMSIGLNIRTMYYFLGGPPVLLPRTPNIIQIEVNENEPLELHCPVVVSSDLSVQWSKNNDELDPMWSTSNMLIRRFLLKIHRTYSTDAGLYKCNVVNGFGSVQAQFQVNVKCKETFVFSYSKERNDSFCLANGTSTNKIANIEQPIVDDWDIDSLNGGRDLLLILLSIETINCRSTGVSFAKRRQFK